MRVQRTKLLAIRLQMIQIRQEGISLVELLLVVALIGFLVIMIASIPNSISLIGKSRNLSLAKEIVSKQIEEKRALPFENLSEGTTAIVDNRMSLLPSSNGTVIIEECTPQVCNNNESLKQVTINIDWKESGKVQNLNVTTLIGEDGL